jgi:DNA-binding IclR family transcriptional regulator
MKKILDYLKKYGESVDIDIAHATGLSLINVHQHLTELKAKSEIMYCHATRFEDGIKSEVMICRLVATRPIIKPAKKTKPQMEMR